MIPYFSPPRKMQDLKKLDTYRKTIDRIDNAIIELLKERFATTAKVQQFKSNKQLPLLQTQREKTILARLKKLAGKKVPHALVHTIYRLIFTASRLAK